MWTMVENLPGTRGVPTSPNTVSSPIPSLYNYNKNFSFFLRRRPV
jgi:hypothetical protein